MKKILLAIVASSLIIGGCSKKKAQALPENHVDIAIVHPYNVPYTFDYPGNISGFTDFPVIPRVSGILEKKLYKEGSFVKKGQIIYIIDPRPYEMQLAADEGSLVKDNAAMVENKSILERNQRLYKINAVATQDVENAVINYKDSEGLVETDKANIKNDKLNIEYCKVASPIDGLISEQQVTTGIMVNAYQTTLNNINTASNMFVNFSVPENDRLALQQGVKNGSIIVPKEYKFQINVELADGTVFESAGFVNFMDTRISESNGTWSMRADVNNKTLPNALLSGQFVHVYLNGAFFKNSIAIPQEAVFRDNKGAFVYVVGADNKIVRKQIVTGSMTGPLWIINSGIDDNDKVVINGGMKVVPGDKVVIDTTTDQNATNMAASK